MMCDKKLVSNQKQAFLRSYPKLVNLYDFKMLSG